MKLELRHVAPVRAANVVSLLDALSMLVVAVPMFALFSLLPEPTAPSSQQPQVAFSVFRWVFVAYPVLGLVFGWIAGLAGAFLYNLVAARVGGLRLAFLSWGPPAEPPAA
jgi:hypothetical protein